MADPLVAAGFTSEGTRTHDALFAGDAPRVTRAITLTGGPYVRGTVLGVITANAKRTKSLAASNDGSEVPRDILAADADGSAADVAAIVYESGEFNEAALTLGAGHTAASIREGLSKLGIFLKKIVGA